MMEKKKIDETKTIEFLSKLELKSSSRIYVSFVRRFFDVSEKDSLDIIEILNTLDILKPIYKIKISNRLLPEEYEFLRDIPPIIFDEESYEDRQINFSENVFVFFKVIKDE
ncbi:hypothetical protein A5886_002657 [Enterococcus sp. 8G7_MSG3316]|uniref:Uncharacterized protein n=2 Tax=Candidatus Enterococcus testudinis TaxID=1834191 RepID=A0A242A932_9ENTE|nr:hypothetical protein A5886_002657 [Enterococcus sp. 8G7_MSG3316]